MIYLVMLIALVILAVLLWKAFGPDTSAPTAGRAGRTLGPDDDPEFMWRMNHRTHPTTGENPENGPADPKD